MTEFVEPFTPINGDELPPLSPTSTMSGTVSASNTIRNSVLGKRQLNRFSWFVTSGVEEFILMGGEDEKIVNGNGKENDQEDESEVTESDKHYIEVSMWT